MKQVRFLGFFIFEIFRFVSWVVRFLIWFTLIGRDQTKLCRLLGLLLQRSETWFATVTCHTSALMTHFLVVSESNRFAQLNGDQQGVWCTTSERSCVLSSQTTAFESLHNDFLAELNKACGTEGLVSSASEQSAGSGFWGFWFFYYFYPEIYVNEAKSKVKWWRWSVPIGHRRFFYKSKRYWHI